MQDGRPRLYQQPLRKHTWSSDLAAPKELPVVAIVYAYVGLTADDVRRLAQGKAGLVITGLGHGKMPEPVWQALQPLMEQGLVVVRAARALGGMVTPVPAYDGTVTADSLTPQKAKILLQLALCRTKDLSEIQLSLTPIDRNEGPFSFPNKAGCDKINKIYKLQPCYRCSPYDNIDRSE